MELDFSLFKRYTSVSEEEAVRLDAPYKPWNTVEVRPPRGCKLPSSLERFVRGIEEYQTRYLKLKNVSPTVAFEIRRPKPCNLKFQFSTPTKRLNRKIRNLLAAEIPDADFEPGTDGLPITPHETLGGGIVTAGRDDWYPFQTEFDQPALNELTALLHRDSMKDTKLVVQILFQPVIGKPFRRWIWRKLAYRRRSYLRKDKHKLWSSRTSTPREKRQADAIGDKAGSNRFYTTIRFAIIGAGENTSSRVKEVAGGFRILENGDTDQYINTVTIKSVFRYKILRFSRAVAERRFAGYSRKFQASVPELAAIVALPSIEQRNITYSKP